MPTLTRDRDVHVLDLGEDENRFSPDWLTAMNDALDKVLAEPAPLITLGSGRFYSNGLDLDWLSSHLDEMASYTGAIQALFARILTLPVPTVAAINGHAFGGGAMLAMAHDWRIMREDRGYFCFPEVDIQIPFTPGMAALIQSKLTPRQANDTMTTGRRYGGPIAVQRGLVDATAPLDELFPLAVSMVIDLQGKHTDTLGAIKNTMYATTVAALVEEDHR